MKLRYRIMGGGQRDQAQITVSIQHHNLTLTRIVCRGSIVLHTRSVLRFGLTPLSRVCTRGVMHS